MDRRRGGTLDEAYEDDDQGAEWIAEELMLDAALEIATGSDRRYDWSSGRVYRDLWEEREKVMQLISRETSFVAIERRDTPIVGEVALREVPIALTAGWAAHQQCRRRSGTGGQCFLTHG
jgi:hypothetical protein